MKKRGKTYKLSLFTIVVIMAIGLLSSFFAACEPSHDIMIENGTSSTLVIFGGRTKIATLEPGGRVTREVSAPYRKWLISAKDLSGTTVYSKEWTVEELTKSNWKVVIVSP